MAKPWGRSSRRRRVSVPPVRGASPRVGEAAISPKTRAISGSRHTIRCVRTASCDGGRLALSGIAGHPDPLLARRLAEGVVVAEDGNGIAPPWRRRVLTVTAAGHLGAQSLARRHSLGYGESRVRSTASGYEGLEHSTHRTLCRPGPHVASHRFLHGPSASRITARTSPGLR